MVDDGQTIGEIAAGLMVGVGDISVDVVPTGQAALDKLLSADYDAVVSEYDLPDMNGIDLLRGARQGGFAKTSIILTASVDESVALDAIVNGADHYLPKTGNPSKDTALIRDILYKLRGRREAERERRTGEAYHSLLMRMAEGFAYHRIIHDEHGSPISSIIIDANDPFEAVLGRNGEEVIGRDVRTLLSGEDELDRRLLIAYDNIVLSGKEAKFEVFSSRLDRWFSVALFSPEAGHFATIIGDLPVKAVKSGIPCVTEKDQGRMLKNYELIFDSTPALISVKDHEGNIIMVNRTFADKMNVRLEDVPRLHTQTLYPDLYEDMRREDPEIIRTGRSLLGLEKRIRTMTGDAFWGQVDKLPFRGEDGRVIGVITYVVDISSRKEIERELELARKKLHLLGSITRHDILNKLSALNGYLVLALMKPDPQAMATNINKAIHAGEQIKKMLEFSRAYEKVGAQRPEWFSAQELAIKGISESHPSEVAVNVDLKGLEIFADRMMEKTFHNLVDNAIRHGKATAVDIFYERSDNGVRIICQDNGVGVAEGSRELMFDDRFGHGLYLVKEILHLTGMSIKETSPGKGARFEITVPEGSYRLTSRD